MDEKLVAVIKTHLPPGSEVVKIFKDASGEVKVDVSIGGSPMTVTLKKNHTGELYIE